MTQQIRLGAIALISAIGLGFMLPPAAHAGREGRRNTALALGAVAAYGLVKKKPVIAGVAGAGAVYSFVRSQQDDDHRHRHRRYYRDRGRYRDYRYARDYRYDRGYRYGRDYRYDRDDYRDRRYYRGSRYHRDRDCD